MPFRRFPEHAPVPVEALFGGDVVHVFFDQLLVDGPLDAANWSVYYDGAIREVDSAEASGEVVELALGWSFFQPGTDGVSYAASPADVVGENGKPADAFQRYPFS